MVRPAAAKAPEFRPKDHPATEELRQELVRAFARRDAIDRRLQQILTQLQQGGSSTGAPADAEYLLCTADGDLPNARVLTEGTNVTFDDSTPGQRIVNVAGGLTTEQIEDLVAAMVQDTASVVWTYTDGSSELEANVPAEFIQDTVGAMVVAGTGITVAYSDVAGTVTIATTITQYTNEMAEDAIGAAIVDSATLDWTYNDGTGQISGVVIESGLAMNAPSYVCLANTAALPNERRLREGHGIDITDGGAGGDVTVAVDESELALGSGLLWDGSNIIFDPSTAAQRTIYNVDFSTLGNNTLSNGTESVDGANYTIANAAAANLFEILNGSGLHFDANATSSAFSTGTQTASYATVTWNDLLGANFDPLGLYVVEIYISSRTMTVNGNKFCFGVLTESALGFGDMGMATILRTGGVTVARHEAAGGSTSTGVSAFTGTTLHLVIDANLVRSYGGTYAAGFPTPANWTFLGQSTCGTGANADQSSFLSPSARLVYGFATGEAGATMDVVVAAKRVRRVR